VPPLVTAIAEPDRKHCFDQDHPVSVRFFRKAVDVGRRGLKPGERRVHIDRFVVLIDKVNIHGRTGAVPRRSLLVGRGYPSAHRSSQGRVIAIRERFYRRFPHKVVNALLPFDWPPTLHESKIDS